MSSNRDPRPVWIINWAMRSLSLVPVLFLLPLLNVRTPSLSQVHLDLTAGRADEALTELNSVLSTDPNNAAAHNLLCRVYYQEDRWDEAIKECELAVRLVAADSEYHLWLGRAYGRKADAIHSLKAFGLARKVHSEFERAVQLDSNNFEALSDLGDFYIEAPGIVGGGKNKAQGVAKTLEAHDPAQGYQIRARLAEKDKDYALAEQNFRAAVEVSKEAPDAWMTLASSYARRKEEDKMLATGEGGDRCRWQNDPSVRTCAGGRSHAAEPPSTRAAAGCPTAATVTSLRKTRQRTLRPFACTHNSAGCWSNREITPEHSATARLQQHLRATTKRPVSVLTWRFV